MARCALAHHALHSGNTRQAKLFPVRGEEYGKKRRYEGTEETINLLEKKGDKTREIQKLRAVICLLLPQTTKGRCCATHLILRALVAARLHYENMGVAYGLRKMANLPDQQWALARTHTKMHGAACAPRFRTTLAQERLSAKPPQHHCTEKIIWAAFV